MNPVTFNDKFEPVIVARHGQRDFDLWAATPLFDQCFAANEANEFADELAARLQTNEHEPLLPEVWPFKILRASLRFDEAALKKETAWVHEIRAMRAIELFACHSVRTGVDVIYFSSKDEGEGMIFSFSVMDGGTIHWSGVWLPWVKKFFTADEFWRLNPASESFEEFKNNVGRVLASVVVLFGWFIKSAMSPSSHLVSVTPSKEGKSVQWQKARTHYTYISHGHPANKASVQHGERVQSDAAVELVRMAHNRRAHKRTLRSSRFTYAKGKTIDVRATWVGPKEWKDAGGRQIYKILEPVESELQFST